MLAQPADKRIARAVRRQVSGTPFTIYSLPDGHPMSLKAHNRTLRVLHGRAWLTQDGEDHILEAGQSFRLATARERAVVSGLGAETLVFDLR